MALGGLTPAKFLRDIWQQKPLLIRQGLPDFKCPVDGDELAGLACEEDAESRLVYTSGQHWELHNGPFDGDTFNDLPNNNWTLLVQRADQWIPEVAELIKYFNFLPQWRIEDIMISYAVKGGGVGPHFDRYDVFLIQGKGQREWQIGQCCDDSEPLQANQPLHLLANFEEQERHILNPGDILYIPPGVAHWGTALTNDCITLSVGFRAPSLAQILERWWDILSSELTEDLRYRDVTATLRSGQTLDDSHIAHIRQLLRKYLNDDHNLILGFGELITEAAGDNLPHTQPCAVPRGDVFRALDSRITLYAGKKDAILFANGLSEIVPLELVSLLTSFCELVPGEQVPDRLWLSLLDQSQEAASFLLSSGGLLSGE